MSDWYDECQTCSAFDKANDNCEAFPGYDCPIGNLPEAKAENGYDKFDSYGFDRPIISSCHNWYFDLLESGKKKENCGEKYERKESKYKLY